MKDTNIYIVDTTLRDGAQSPYVHFTRRDRLDIALYLEEMGVYQIEAGIPAMGEYEKETIKLIQKKRVKSLISTWNRLKLSDVKESIDCNPDIIHISVPTSNIQINTKLNKDKKWVKEELSKIVKYTIERGFEVTVGFEDASRTKIEYLINLCEMLEEIGVKRIRYADTIGIMTPLKINQVINSIKKNTKMDIEIHAHNDFGMAIGNSIQAVCSGAKFVNCTIEGIGERAGNCNLNEFIEAIKNNEKYKIFK